MYPTQFRTPPGGAKTPLEFNESGVGESDVVFMGDRVYYITKSAYDRLQTAPKPIQSIVSQDKKFRLLSVGLGITNILTFALYFDVVYSRIVLTLLFSIFLATLLIALKGKQPIATQPSPVLNEKSPEVNQNPEMSQKDKHKLKTALAMIRQVKATSINQSSI